MAWWQRQTAKNTKNRIVTMLARGEHTVEELAQQLGVTDNAVRAQLATLEREKIVASAGIRRDGSVGKPAVLYGLATESSALFSAAYAPVLAAVLAELGEAMTPRQLEALLKRAGRSLAKSLPPRATFDERVKGAVAFLGSVGAEADLVQGKGTYELRGHGCVLAEAVSRCPATCVVLEQLLRDVTGGEVTEHCDRTTEPRCRFSISPAA